MKREIRFFPAYHKIHEDPSQNYGVHGVEIHFILSGDEGAVVFRIFTRAMLPQTYEYWRDRGIQARVEDGKFDDGGVLFHSAKPMYEGQEGPSEDVCPHIGKPCYQDIGFTMGREPRDLLVSEGDEAVWKWMERTYRERFCIAAVPA